MELFTAFKLLVLPFAFWIIGTELLQEREDGTLRIVYLVGQGTLWGKSLLPTKTPKKGRNSSPPIKLREK